MNIDALYGLADRPLRPGKFHLGIFIIDITGNGCCVMTFAYRIFTEIEMPFRSGVIPGLKDLTQVEDVHAPRVSKIRLMCLEISSTIAPDKCGPMGKLSTSCDMHSAIGRLRFCMDLYAPCLCGGVG